MVLKRKVTGIVLAGVLAVAAVAPLGMSASAANNGDVKVSYTTGVIKPDGSKLGNYSVSIPANVNFNNGETAVMDIGLHRDDVNQTLDTALEVEVGIKSLNNYTLKSSAYQNVEGDYTLAYVTNPNEEVTPDWGDTATNTESFNQTNGNKTNGIAQGLDGNVLQAKLTPLDSLNSTTNNVGESLVGYIRGRVQLDSAPADVEQKGTEFSDTLTFYVREATTTDGPNDQSTWQPAP